MASLMTERLELVPQRAGSLAARIQVLSALLHLEISSGRAAGGWWYRSGRHLACVPVVSGHSARYVDVRRSATAFARSLYREGESSGHGNFFLPGPHEHSMDYGKRTSGTSCTSTLPLPPFWWTRPFRRRCRSGTSTAGAHRHAAQSQDPWALPHGRGLTARASRPPRRP